MRPQTPQDQTSYAAADTLARRMWKLLGEKTKWRDDAADWTPILLARWQDSGMSREDFEKIMVWALTENPYTVENLRLARNPAQSLFVNQWENVEAFYDAAMAAKKARLRKSWRNGACQRCTDKEARREGGLCANCDRYGDRVFTLLTAAYRRGLAYTQKDKTVWLLYTEPLEINPKAVLIAQGVVDFQDVRGSVYNGLMDDEPAVAMLEETLKTNGTGFISMVEGEPGRGFDAEEA